MRLKEDVFNLSVVMRMWGDGFIFMVICVSELGDLFGNGFDNCWIVCKY